MTSPMTSNVAKKMYLLTFMGLASSACVKPGEEKPKCLIDVLFRSYYVGDIIGICNVF